MKNLRLLISTIIILGCSFSVNAQENPDDIYSKAKSAFNDNDCRSTISLLTTYLTLENPNQAKLDSIYSVIGWCTTYLKKGQIYHQISGIVGPDRSYYEETALGSEMKKHKKALP